MPRLPAAFVAEREAFVVQLLKAGKNPKEVNEELKKKYQGMGMSPNRIYELKDQLIASPAALSSVPPAAAPAVMKLLAVRPELDKVVASLDKQFEKMQTPGAKAAAKSAFETTPAQLGEAAVKAAFSPSEADKLPTTISASPETAPKRGPRAPEIDDYDTEKAARYAAWKKAGGKGIYEWE